MADPTAEEIAVLKEFRLKVRDLGLDDASDLYMLRWLRARDLNIPASEDLLRRHLKWRQEEDLDNVLEWKAPPNFDKDYNYEITGWDKEGHPICIISFGVWDVRKIITSGIPGMREAWLRHVDKMFAKIFAKMKESSVQIGREVTQCVLIVDFAEFSMRQLTSFANVGTILEAVKRFESNYPEILFQFYFINAFRVFKTFFALMKPLLSARTLGKLEIYTTPDKWLPVVKSRLPLDQIPVELGGTQAGRRVSTGSDIGPDSENLDAAEMASFQVPAGDKTKLEFTVAKPRSTLTWTIKVEAYDIGFSVTFGDEECISGTKFKAETGTVVGSIVCEKTGEYFLNFDNSYSRMRGKTVFWNVDVIEPTISNETINES